MDKIGAYTSKHVTVFVNNGHPSKHEKLAHCLRRWPSTKSTSGQRLLFAGT